jgi:hypothetical protein
MRATDSSGQSVQSTFSVSVNAVADTPTVTNATTNRDTQTTSGLVIMRNAVDGSEVTHYRITAITNGTVYLNNGTTAVVEGGLVTAAQGAAGLKFTPSTGLTSPGSNFGFTVQAAVGTGGQGLSGTIRATVIVNDRSAVASADGTTVFNWSSAPGAVRYDIWVMDLTTGQNPVVRNAAATGQSWTAVLTPGHSYRWWVGAVSSSGATSWSSSLDFSISALSAPTPAGPTGVLTMDAVSFEWSAVTGAGRYDVWVDNTTTGQSQVLRNASVNGTSWTPSTTLTPGHGYRWWVGSVSVDGAATTWSGVQTFRITALGAPAATGPGTGTLTTDRPTFAWNAVTGAARYDVWVDDTTTGRTQVLRDTNITQTSWTPSVALTPGHNYRWWVGAVSTNGLATTWSSMRTFAIAPVGVPVLQDPSGTIATTTPTFRWAAATLAARYDVWVDDLTTGQSQALRNTNVASTSWTPTTALVAGHRYRWWVRGFSANETAGAWSSPLDFTVAGS